MTNYNDGLWHGHNGESCPVHPKAEVVCQLEWRQRQEAAGWFDWSSDASHPVIAFRVIKEYKEPERTWSRCVDGSTYRNVELKFIDGIPHVREVLE